jgi:CHRD domain/PEP-CTERM motif
MRKHLICAVALAFATCASANAAIINLFANLTPFEEQPAAATPIDSGGLLRPFTQGPGLAGGPRPVSSGFAHFTLNTAVPVLNMTVTVFNIDVTGSQTPFLNDDLRAAHIHAGPTAIPAVSAAGVVWGFFGMPFDDDDGDVKFAAFTSGVGGTFTGQWDLGEGNNTTLAAQLAFITNELSYINFHTAQFTGGEIRGQLIVPEPGSLALLGIALGALGFSRRRKKT